jgi:hypothetical protein
MSKELRYELRIMGERQRAKAKGQFPNKSMRFEDTPLYLIIKGALPCGKTKGKRLRAKGFRS